LGRVLDADFPLPENVSGVYQKTETDYVFKGKGGFF